MAKEFFENSDKVYTLGGGVTVRRMNDGSCKPFVVLNSRDIAIGYYSSLEAALESQMY